ncbi:MAG: sugar transferase, partial [Actinomycetota bacterium]|nr:sugar transferase [Actinomycetota bacterium]
METAPAPRPRVFRRRNLPAKPAWERSYSLALVALDLVALSVAATLAQFLRFGSVDSFLKVGGDAVAYLVVASSMVSVWLAVLALSGGYSPRVVGVGSEEFRRVFNSAVRFLALAAVVFYAARLEVARGFVGGFVVTATVLTMLGRYGARRWLHRRRGDGRFMHRVVVVGSIEAVTHLASHLQRTSYAGFTVVGACVPAAVEFLLVGERHIPIFGEPGENVLDALATVQANVLAIAGDSALPPGSLRALAWQLEGTGIDLIVAPAVTDVAGPRI